MLRKVSAALAAMVLLMTAAHAIEVQEVVSDSGVKAVLVEDYTVPLVALSFSFKGGASQDAAGKEGTAQLLTTLLDEGAGDIGSEEFLARLEELGVQYRYSAGQDSFGGSVFTLKSNLDETFELIGLALAEPRFDAEPVARMKTAALSALRRKEAQPGTIAGEAFRKAVFAGHPYGRPDDGTPETVASITREDIVDYHRRNFARDNLTVGVVGAISAEELKVQLDRLFGSLPQKSDLRPVPEATIDTGERVHVDLDVPQTTITFALPGMKRDDPDFFAAYLVNHILGGGSFNSRLYDEVREKRGLAYSVYSYLGTRDHAGFVGAGSATRADRAKETVDIIRRELKRMADEGPTAEELEAAKKFIKGTYAISNLDTSQKIAGVLVAIQEGDLGLDYIDRRQDLIDAVTLDDAKRVAKELLSAEPTVITVGRPLDAANDNLPAAPELEAGGTEPVAPETLEPAAPETPEPAAAEKAG